MSRHLLLLLLVLSACTDRQSAAKKLEPLVMEAALVQGNKISSTSQKALGGQLTTALAEGGSSYAVEFCNARASSIVDSLETAFGVKIKRASLRFRNPEDQPTDREMKVLQKVNGQLRAGEELIPIVEALDRNQVLYAKAILIDNPMCLNCHGEIGSQIGPKTANLLKAHYPGDLATNHKMGDLRGIWSITFDKAKLLGEL